MQTARLHAQRVAADWRNDPKAAIEIEAGSRDAGLIKLTSTPR
jgi:hypothetical protein